MTALASLKQRIGRRHLEPTLGFVHIPKAGGTGMVGRIDTLLRPRSLVYRLDRSQFGGFTDFASMPSAVRSGIVLDPAGLPPGIDCLAGHLAPSTILAYAPGCRLITCLRIPQTRLLSHYTYWRGYDDTRLAAFGGWGRMIAFSRLDLAEFLSEPAIASQTDNLITRMLLWPRQDIPPDGFIDRSQDTALLTEAEAMIDRFAHVDVIENPGFETCLEQWLQAAYGRSVWQRLRQIVGGEPPGRTNQAAEPFVASRLRLAEQLEGVAGRSLFERSRLDIVLWSKIAGKSLPLLDGGSFVEAEIARSVARYDRLSGFDRC